jgi:polysaccharide export outer membrane protein
LATQEASPAEDIQVHEARISPGDVVAVRIFGVPEMSQELRVSNGGNILLPLVGQIRAQGLTTTELEQKIADSFRLGGFMNDPQVNVEAKELRSAMVSVAGEVGKPGVYAVYGGCRLQNIIMTAGGLTPGAGQVVTLTRADRPEVPISANVSSREIEIFPGDTVVVTKAGMVYVMGNVSHPAAFVMENHGRMTVLEVLAMAGGTSQNAKIKGARIIRKSPQGVQDIPIPLKEILMAHTEDVELLAGDVLYIPTSEVKAAARLGANSIITAAAALAITRP